MMAQTGIQLPVSHQQVDPSCFNNNLPQGNDKWPTVQFLPGADTQLGGYAIALFRGFAQSRAAKSSIHCVCYNLLQMQQFQNQFWQQWCQYVVDFTDFLQRGQQQPPQQAAEKAATRIYQCMLATVLNQYPAVRQFLDQNTQVALNDAAALAGNITNDINQWRQRVMQGGGQQGIGVGMQNSMPGMMMPNNGNNPNAFTVQGVGHTASPGYINPGAPSTSASGGMLLGTTSAPSKPTSSFVAGSQPQGLAPMHSEAHPAPQAAQKSGIIDHDHNAPINVADLKVEPKYYVPNGHSIDPARPYDHIRNPGGVEIRPAHQVLKSKDKASWKRTVGSDTPYGVIINPNTHMLFLAKWVDGVVKEVVVPLVPEMDYLKHELSEELRRMAMRPKGIVVPLPTYATSPDQTVKTVEQTQFALESGLVKPEALSPVSLEGYITGTSDLENEALARNSLVVQLGLSSDDPVPPHEYISVRMHELDISDECFQELHTLKAAVSPTVVVETLKKLVESGALPLRYFNFINDRLTRSVNDFLQDSLSIEKIKIGNYMDDAVELAEYLRNKRSSAYEEVYLGNTSLIIGRALSVACESPEVADGEDPEKAPKSYGIIDEYLNFQLGLPSEELSNLNLTTEACVVSPTAHPNIVIALRAMSTRATELGIIKQARMRLITSDGFYYEVIMGKLVKGALLLKRI